MISVRHSLEIRTELGQLEEYVNGLPTYLADVGYVAPYRLRERALREELLAAEAYENGLRLNAPIQILRVMRGWADRFAVPLDFLGQLCRHWAALSASALAVLRARNPELFDVGPDAFLAIPASPASYSIGVAIQHPQAYEIYEMVSRAMSTGGEITSLRENFRISPTLDRVAFRSLLSLLADSNVDLDVGFMPVGSGIFTGSVRITADYASRGSALLGSAERTERDTAMEGQLLGASITRGRIEVKDASGNVVVATVEDPQALRGLRIGARYVVKLRELVSRDIVTGRESVAQHVLALEPGAEPNETPERIEPEVAGTLSSDLVPEGSDLSKVYTIVQVIGQKRQPVPADIKSKHKRWVQYYKHAARILGYLTEAGRLTRVGRQAARMTLDAFMTQTALQFEVSDVGAAWLEWAGASSLLDLKPDQARIFLGARTLGLSDKNADCRASTLRTWLRRLQRHHYARPGHERDA